MAVSEQSQQKTIYQILLSDHNVTNLLPKRWHPLAQFSYFLRNFLRRFHTVCSDSLRSENVRSNRLHSAAVPLSMLWPKRAKGDSTMWVLKSWHRLGFVVVLACLAGALLAWIARTDPAINYLPRHRNAEWIVFPTAVEARAHDGANMDATFRREFIFPSKPAAARLRLYAMRRAEVKVNE